MATLGLLENGPMTGWTSDDTQYKHYTQWKQWIDMVFKSALKTANELTKCEYLKYWLGKEGLPQIKCWDKSDKIPTAAADDAGNKLDEFIYLCLRSAFCVCVLCLVFCVSNLCF